MRLWYSPGKTFLFSSADGMKLASIHSTPVVYPSSSVFSTVLEAEVSRNVMDRAELVLSGLFAIDQMSLPVSENNSWCSKF